MMQEDKKNRNQKGISMPEIMASITIMAILAGTGVKSAVNQVNSTRLIATMDEMASISRALDEYHIDHPGSTTTITTLVTQKYLAEGFTSAPETSLKTNLKKDAWENDYRLTSPLVDQSGVYLKGKLESAGADGIFDDDSTTTSYDETDDNITLMLEPMIAGD
jgi:type II secretory pathway pseudopilin PulG